MLKKFAFVIMVLLFIIAGALVSLANNEEEFVYNNFTVNDYIYDNEEFYEKKEYSHEAVVEMYSSLFFDADIKTDVEYIKDIVFNENSKTADNNKDYLFNATLSDNVELENENIIVMMFFIKNGDTFEELIPPEEIECNLRLIAPININLPNVGKDNPNSIRIIVFPKNNYKDLSADNIQVYDIEIFINSTNFFKGSLKNASDLLNQFINSKVYQ